MQVDSSYILEQYPGDKTIVEEFVSKYRNYTFDNYLHMINEYEKYVDSLNLQYIAD